MKKYKIFFGMCGPTPLVSSIIKANDKREALIKYYESRGEGYTEEQIQRELDKVFEYIPQPRKKKE